MLISAAQREAGPTCRTWPTEWMARFTDQAARQQQHTADAFAELLQVHGARRTRRPCSAAWVRTSKCRAQAEFAAIVAELARVE